MSCRPQPHKLGSINAPNLTSFWLGCVPCRPFQPLDRGSCRLAIQKKALCEVCGTGLVHSAELHRKHPLCRVRQVERVPALRIGWVEAVHSAGPCQVPPYSMPIKGLVSFCSIQPIQLAHGMTHAQLKLAAAVISLGSRAWIFSDVGLTTSSHLSPRLKAIEIARIEARQSKHGRPSTGLHVYPLLKNLQGCCLAHAIR